MPLRVAMGNLYHLSPVTGEGRSARGNGCFANSNWMKVYAATGSLGDLSFQCEEEMTKKEDKTAKKADVSFPSPFTGIPGLTGNLLESYSRAGKVFFETAFDLNQEMMRFASSRFRADMDALQTLGQCTDWQDLLSFQSDFARSAADAYMTEMPELTVLATRTCAALCAPMFEPAKVLSEAPAKT